MDSNSCLFRDIATCQYESRDPIFIRRRTSGYRDIVQRLSVSKKLAVHNGCVNTITWNESGRYILSGSDDQHLIITDPFSGKVEVDLHSGHRANIFSAKFLPCTNDRKIISCSGDGIIFFTDLDQDQSNLYSSFDCHCGTVYKIVTVPQDPNSFLSCGEDGTVRWFDLRIKQKCAQEDCREDVLINCRRAVTALAVNPSLPYQLAVGCSDSSVRVYDRRMLGTKATGCIASKGITGLISRFCAPELENRTNQITSLRYSPCGDELLVSYSSESVYLYNTTISTDSNTKLTTEHFKVTTPENGFHDPEKMDQLPDQIPSSSLDEVDESAGAQDELLTVEAGATADKGNASKQPPVKRLRLRGDWSDTGPNARPEHERSHADRAAVNIMQRMSDMLTRWLEVNRQNGNQEQGVGQAADASSGPHVEEAMASSNSTEAHPGETRQPESDEVTSGQVSGAENQPYSEMEMLSSPSSEECVLGHSTDGMTQGAEPCSSPNELVNEITGKCTIGGSASATNSTQAANDESPCDVDYMGSSLHGTESPEVQVQSACPCHDDSEAEASCQQTQPQSDVSVQCTRVEVQEGGTGETLVGATKGRQVTGTSNSNNPQVVVQTDGSIQANSTCDKLVTSIADCANTAATSINDAVHRPSPVEGVNNLPSAYVTSERPQLLGDDAPSSISNVESVQSIFLKPSVNSSAQPSEKTNSSCATSSQSTCQSSNTVMISPKRSCSRLSVDDSYVERTSDVSDTAAVEASPESVILNNQPSTSMESLIPDNQPSTSMESLIPDNQPSTSMESLIPDNQPSASVEAPIPDSQPSASVEAPIPDSQPSAAVEAPIPDSQPSASAEAQIPDSQPSASVEAPIPDSQPSSSVEAPIPDSQASAPPDTPTPDNQAITLSTNHEGLRYSSEYQSREPSGAPIVGRQRRVGHSGPPTGDFQLHRDHESSDDDSDTGGMRAGSSHQHSSSGLRLDRPRRSENSFERQTAAIKLQQLYRKRQDERQREEERMLNLPQPTLCHKYEGHRNARTMIKEVAFWGDHHIMSGSDCGHVFVWDRQSEEVVMLLEADRHVVNCIQPHPTDPILATSGIDYDIKIWNPCNILPSFDFARAKEIQCRNKTMLEETRDTITVPASFMLRMLASLNHFRSGQHHGNSAEDQSDDSSDH